MFQKIQFTDDTYIIVNSNIEDVDAVVQLPVDLGVITNCCVALTKNNQFLTTAIGKTKTDLAGNTWKFEQGGSSYGHPRLRITINNGSTTIGILENTVNQDNVLWYLDVRASTTTSYSVRLTASGNVLYRNSSSDRFSAGYISGENGSYTFVADIADNQNKSESGYFKNFIPSGDFASLQFSAYNNIFSSITITTLLSTGGNATSTQTVDLPKEIFVPATPEPEDTDPYSDIDGESDITGGGSIAIPGFPPATATATGIVGLFAPSEAQMRALGDYMWTDFGGQGTTEVDVLKEIFEAIKRSISSPLDYVIGLNIIPSQGLSIGSSQTIRFGYLSTGVSMPRLSSQYFEVDCGSISFPPLCGDTFLDYAPYSKFSIYLPYIGFKDLDANDCVGHTIGVKYHGDTVTGGVMAYITKDGSVMYQYSGCCALSIPLSADGWGSTIGAAVEIATSMATGGIAGGAAGVGKEAALGSASVASNPSLLSPQVQHSGAISGGAGCMGVQYPFIVREAVRFHSTSFFNTVSGYPSYYYRKLSEVSGYTTVLDVHLHNMTATEDEISEIERLLKEGVIL